MKTKTISSTIYTHSDNSSSNSSSSSSSDIKQIRSGVPKIGKLVGSGTFGKVFDCADDSRSVVKKSVLAKHEAEILDKTRKSNYTMTISASGKGYLVMPKYQQSLDKCINTMKKSQILVIIYRMAHAIHDNKL